MYKQPKGDAEGSTQTDLLDSLTARYSRPEKSCSCDLCKQLDPKGDCNIYDCAIQNDWHSKLLPEMMNIDYFYKFPSWRTIVMILLGEIVTLVGEGTFPHVLLTKRKLNKRMRGQNKQRWRHKNIPRYFILKFNYYCVPFK